MAYGLSKSRLMSFRQCAKRLWLDVHRPELAVNDPQTEAIFATGHEVGAIAQRLYDDGRGVLIEYDRAMVGALARTQEVLAHASTSPIFEATFERDGLLIRADVLLRGTGGPKLIEVKSSSSLKPEHVDDCTIQYWVLEHTTTRPGAVFLAHINNQFVYERPGDYTGLLTENDLTAEVRAASNTVPALLEQAKEVAASSEPPSPIGSRCSKPYDCPYRGYCWKDTEYPLTGLPSIGKHLDALLGAGHFDIRDLPESSLRGEDQKRVWRATRSGKAELRPGSRAALEALPYPRYYLDFETAGSAVPRWTGTRPFQQIPFQWSLHVEQRDGSLEHHEFLDLSGNLPVRAAAEALLAAIQRDGPIFMFTSFERTCINTLAAFCPDLKDPLERLANRLVDLHPIAKQHYYHPAMRGSWSIKAILPTIAPELDYASLTGIADGMAAQRAYAEAISGDTDPNRVTVIGNELLKYCKHDTLAMVTLARYLMTGGGTAAPTYQESRGTA
jgi:hypothetical protein